MAISFKNIQNVPKKLSLDLKPAVQRRFESGVLLPGQAAQKLGLPDNASYAQIEQAIIKKFGVHQMDLNCIYQKGVPTKEPKYWFKEPKDWIKKLPKPEKDYIDFSKATPS